jgi:hypothetical protein
VRYDLQLIQELCVELQLRSAALSAEEVEVDLGGGAVLCFVNSEHDQDCLVGFKGTPWHAHDDFTFHDRQGNCVELNYLDVLTGLKEGKVLVCERWQSGLLADRWLLHAELHDEFRYINEGEEVRVWKAPRYADDRLGRFDSLLH